MNLKISYLVLGLGIIPAFGNIAHAENPGYIKDEASFNEIIDICKQLVAGSFSAQTTSCPDLKCDDTSTAQKFKDLVKAMKKCYKPDQEFKENDIVGKIRELCNDKAINCTVEGGILSKEKKYECFDSNKTAYTYTYKDKTLTPTGTICAGCEKKASAEGAPADQYCRWYFNKSSEKDVITALVKEVGGEKKKYSCSLSREAQYSDIYSCTYENSNPLDIKYSKEKGNRIEIGNNIDKLRATWGLNPSSNTSNNQDATQE